MSTIRANGKIAVTILLNEQDAAALRLIMEADSRETMTDCIRSIIRKTAKNFLPAESVTITDNATARTKHATGS